MIISLAGTQPAPRLVVDDQQVADIMQRLIQKHYATQRDYDKIYQQFLGGSIEDICKRLWVFCRKNMNYVVENEDSQFVSCPYTILLNGKVDCKNYALFCGGVLDAMKRHGMPFNWCYRFASYEILSFVPGHVFVVVNENTDNIWLDPVIDVFNYHTWYWHKTDRKIKRRSVGRVMGAAANSYIHLVNGTPYANDQSIRSNGLTADEMGLPYAMQLLSKGSGGGYDGRHPGTADAWWQDPPVTFWLNNRPFPLPPPNQYGQPAPLLPLGLQVRYAPEFGGFNVPAGFMAPIVAQGPAGGQNYLRLSPDLFPIDTQLSTHDSLPLILLEAAVGPLINAYSTYPYASNFSSTNNIDDKMFNHRNAFDLLQPSISKTVLMTVAKDALPVVATIAKFIPIIGPAISSLAKSAEPAVNTPTAAGPELVNPYSPYNAPTSIIPGVNNNILGIGAVALLFFLLFNKN